MHARDAAERRRVDERHARQIEAQETAIHRDVRVEHRPEECARRQV
jgi:hypothetical protein